MMSMRLPRSIPRSIKIPFQEKPNVLTDVSLLHSREPTIDQFHKIVANHRPHKIELGNESLYDYAIQYFEKRRQDPPLLIVHSPKNPTIYPLISYRTSISPLYQTITEKMTVKEIHQKLEEAPRCAYKKLYVTCLTECPVTGPIDVAETLHEVCRYFHRYDLDEISLCDTCGTLTYENFRYLVSSLLFFGVPTSRVGFQLRKTADFPYMRRYAREHGWLNWDVVDTPVYRQGSQISYEDIE